MTAPINTFRALAKLAPPPGQQFSVGAYFLGSPGADGIPVTFYINLGNYPNHELAKQRAQEILEMTGHPAIICAPLGTWQDLGTAIQPDRVEYVSKETELEAQHQKAMAQQAEEEQKRKDDEAERLRQEEERVTPGTLEFFIHNYYVLIRNYSAWKYHHEERTQAFENYNKRMENVVNTLQDHPEYQDQWLAKFEEQLKKHNEGHLFEKIVAVVPELQKMIDSKLGCVGGVCMAPPVEEECEGGVCFAPPVNEEECEGGVCMAPENVPLPESEDEN